MSHGPAHEPDPALEGRAEYPKVIHVNGVTVTVGSVEEEEQWRNTPAEAVADAEPVSPLDDVEVEMDDPAFGEPAKKKAAKKK